MTEVKREEEALFEPLVPCNSIPFLKRIREILDENGTNSLIDLQGIERDKALSCLWVLISQSYTTTSLDGLSEYERLAERLSQG